MVDRRQFLQLGALGGGVVVASTLAGCAGLAGSEGQSGRDFTFVQLSDSHWGFRGPENPDAQGTLGKAVAAINALAVQPDFIVFTGDLTHTTDDPVERRRRLAEFKAIVDKLHVKQIHFLPGEHDASLDRGTAYQEYFGPTHYTFDYQGVHCIVLDNVSDPGAALGDDQLAWLRNDLDRQAPTQPIIVFAHRPLFDLAAQWDWTTRDGDQAIALLMPFRNVTVFYGHIHQENHHMTGHIAHHSARSLIFPLPAPGSQPKRTPVPWDASAPYRGLGFRRVHEAGLGVTIQEFPVQGA